VDDPPLTTVGSSPPHREASQPWSSVVVFPCVPDDGDVDLSRMSSASISARRTTGRPRPARLVELGFPGLMAEEITTTSAPCRFSAVWPDMDDGAPGPTGCACGRSPWRPNPGRGSPSTAAPRRCPTCRCPPMPTKWIGPTSCGSLVGRFVIVRSFMSVPAQALDHVGEPSAASGLPKARAARDMSKARRPSRGRPGCAPTAPRA
jgi:hypothetical protein